MLYQVLSSYVFSGFSITLFMVFTLDVNNFEEDSYVDETSETVAQYIVDHLITSVTAAVGMCHTDFMVYYISCEL